MRDLVSRTAKAALIAGAALAVAACGDGDTAPANTALNDLEANMSFEEPANDASAMEAAGNAAETPAETSDNATGDDDGLGDTSGGDTGGNTLDSNVSGM